ncbi:betaine/proline/choline family ABC transporter ATP-binding protein [Aquibacillus koreensis]|uniref:Quaternary amine transport ATP-binding protein n=1 Tax=Aquibacillus koreensis TaxID=279446 RepID=A0A9X3WJB6_9BACI|nr:betaine/proline/choline family ABC transporter ATP-binding protein [Aquibacillus koreensis]MCT2535233.1 betaine/proline/choline family ABC transporter ATP-binding protein [Aquibacillus koreensis]MDC3421092.1 betaine/proline/choline family ABC transporter ATP-binding protein [Aquibacillus koreensis]
MITFDHVTKQFEDGTIAVDDVSFSVAKGKLVTLIGPSGCGKTTTMKMINKLISLSSGSITIDGTDISEQDPVELRRNIGYVIQRIGLLPHMTIEENVALVPKLKGWKKEDYQKEVDDLLDLVGLEPSTYKKRYPLELSGGQQQRIGVIRALAGKPPIILMDEPFSALDPISREQLQDELKLLQKNIQKTIVFVTHDMDEALKISDEVIVMKDGCVQQIATPDTLIHQPSNAFVRSFIGEDRVKQAIETTSKRQASSVMLPLTAEVLQESTPRLPDSSPLQEVAKMMLTSKANKIILMAADGEATGWIAKDQLLKELAGIDMEVI